MAGARSNRSRKPFLAEIRGCDNFELEERMGTMPGNLVLELTEEQQRQFKLATGQDVKMLELAFTPTGQLADADLDKVSGGGPVIIMGFMHMAAGTQDAMKRVL
jgi:hypothetical protein